MSVDQPYKVVFTKRADRDLDRIAEDFLAVAPSSAEDLLRALLGSIDSLKIFPHRNIVAGQSRSGDPVRSLPAPPYMVYFRADDRRQRVNILRVRHGSRRPLRRYG